MTEPSLIRDAINDYGIQDAEGFTIVQMAMVSLALRWHVRCGEAEEIIELWIPSHFVHLMPKEAVDKAIKLTLQATVDRMWSRWVAL